MKKALSVLLSAIMLLACLTGLSLTASADGEVLATLTPDDLVAGIGQNHVTITKGSEGETEFATFTSSGSDPYAWYNGIAGKVGQSEFMKIVYRTSSACASGEYFCKTDNYENKTFTYNNNGEWNTLIVNLSENSQHTNAMGEFRIDPFAGENASGCTIDIQYVEFFRSKDLAEGEYTLDLTTNPFANGIPSVDIGSDVVLGGSLVMPEGAWTSVHYSINGGTWAAASYEAGENGAFENLVIPTNTLAGGIHTVSVQFRNDIYQSVTLSATIHVDLSTVVVGEGNTQDLFEGGTAARPFGVHINALDGLYSFTVQSLATYEASTDTMKVEAFAWNTDIETTLAAKAIWTGEVTGITDNGDATVEFPAGAVKGDVYLQFSPVTTNEEKPGQITPKKANTSVNSDVEFFVEGKKVETGFMGSYVAANPATAIWDLTTGSEEIAFLPTQDASVIKVAPGYIKAIATGEGAAITNVGVNLNPGFKYVGIIYRTNTADATVTVNGSEPVALATDGLWNVAYVDLANTDLETVADLAIGIVGEIDIAYVGIYKSTSLRAASATPAVAARLNRITREQTVYDAEKDALVDIGVMNSSAPVFVYDFSLWMEDPATTFGFANVTHMEMGEHNPANGYVTFNVTEEDPYFSFGTAPTGYANQLRYIVVKYRTTSTTGFEFFTQRSDDSTLAWGGEGTHVTGTYVNDGEWHTAIVDASAVWGNAYGATLNNFRFDPSLAASGSVDISYIAFYSNLAAAEAAAAADEGKAPVAPVDPSTVKPVIIDGESLFTTMGVMACSAKYNYDGGYMTLTAQNGDPSYFLYHNANMTVGPILAIRYRTVSDLVNNNSNECFIGKGELSGDDRCEFVKPVLNDGDWHVAYINLSDIAKAENYPATGKLQVNEDGTVSFDYFRFDFLCDFGEMDVAYIGFFNTVEDLTAYDAQVWTAPKYYKVTFVADEVEVGTVYYREGTESISNPRVPEKEGYTGEWEAFEMGKDVVVNAVYTEIPETTEPETSEPETTTEPTATTEPTTTEPDATTAEPATTEPDATTEPEEEKSGCKSAVAIGAALVAMIALGAVCFKKKD